MGTWRRRAASLNFVLCWLGGSLIARSSNIIVPTSHETQELCRRLGSEYRPGHCYCELLDPCLDATYSEAPLETCPRCAILTTTSTSPATTIGLDPGVTEYDWDRLFTGTDAAGKPVTHTHPPTSPTTSTTTTTSSPTPPDATTVPLNHEGCAIQPFGFLFTSVSTFTGRRCCCPSYSGDALSVRIKIIPEYFGAVRNKTRLGIPWEDAFLDERKPETRKLRRRLKSELKTFLLHVFGRHVMIDEYPEIGSFFRASDAKLGFHLRLVMTQSRVANPRTVEARLKTAFQEYADLERAAGVFGNKYSGYKKTSYDPTSIRVERIPKPTTLTTTEEDLTTSGQAVVEPLAPGDRRRPPIAATVTLLLLGCLVLGLTLGLLIARGGVCFCRAWWIKM